MARARVEDISSLAVDALTVVQNQSVFRLMNFASELSRTQTAMDRNKLRLERDALIVQNTGGRYGMVWCPSYPLDRNRCDQVVAAGSGAG
jgi:hypothetical protein